MASRSLRRLLDERELERDDALDIAAELPVVAVAAVLGAAFAVLLAGVILAGRR